MFILACFVTLLEIAVLLGHGDFGDLGASKIVTVGVKLFYFQGKTVARINKDLSSG